MFTNLKAEMARANITQDILAKEIDVAVSTVGKKINGVTDWTIGEMVKVNALFPKCTIQYLFIDDFVKDFGT